MKAERKHELEHNELDDLLVKGSTFLRENGVLIIAVAGVLILGVVLYWALLAPRPITADAGLWEEYVLALSDEDPEKELQDFIDDEDRAGHSSSPPVLWARLSLGNLKLSKGTRKLFEDREAALDSLEEAEKNFLAVEKNAARIVELRDRAWLGLAEVYESQSKPEEARKYYAMVAKNSPESPLGKLGARGERRMAQSNNQEFLTWFAQQKPIKKPATGLPPIDFNDPPEVPGFSVPPLSEGEGEKPITPGLKIPSKLPDDPGEPGLDSSPESDPEKPQPEKPVEDPPAGEQPAEKPE
jgi:hypothetical protein